MSFNKLKWFESNWYIWIFPLCAILVTGWLGYDYYSKRGPHIRIYVEDAAGIRPEKTTVRFRGVPIGTVKDVSFSRENRLAVADILLRKDAKSFAVEGSRFSLIKPRVGFQGVTGLETIFEGTYFEVTPGPEGGQPKYEFKALPTPPTESLENTSAYLIQADDVESVVVGDGVTYRGMKVGSVTRLSLLTGGQKIDIQINVENRYAHLVRSNTVFWRKVGVQAKLGLFGSEIKLNSMESIVRGGLQFATPSQPGPPAKSLQRFVLAPAAPKDAVKWKPVLD